MRAFHIWAKTKLASEMRSNTFEGTNRTSAKIEANGDIRKNTDAFPIFAHVRISHLTARNEHAEMRVAQR